MQTTDKTFLEMLAPLETIARIQTGYPFRSRLEVAPHGDVQVVQMKDLTDAGDVNRSSLTPVSMGSPANDYFIGDGDILVKGRGLSHTAALVVGDYRRTIAAAPLISIRVTTPTVLPAYLKWWINHPQTQAALSSHAVGTYVRSLSTTALKEIEAPLPPLPIQQQIVELAQLGAREQDLIERLASLRKCAIDSALYRFVRNSRRVPG